MGIDPDHPDGQGRPAEVSITRIVDQLPESVEQVFRRMMRELRRSREELRRLVATHLVRLETASRATDFIDAPLAGHIANLCHRLIDTIGAAGGGRSSAGSAGSGTVFRARGGRRE